MIGKIKMTLVKKYFILSVFILLLTPSYSANRFANQFVSFELPAQWQCVLEGAEWVCQSLDETKKRDAIIIMAAKLKGDQDTLDQYLNHLLQPKVYQSVSNQPVKSEVRYAKYNKYNNHTWVDSLHLESEIPGFYTRYFATIKEDIGVLVTFSVEKDKYSTYQADIQNLVDTIQVFRRPGLNALPQEGSLFNRGSGSFSVGGAGSAPPPSSVFPDTVPAERRPDPSPQKSDDSLFFILIIAGAVILFIIWKKRQNSR